MSRKTRAKMTCIRCKWANVLIFFGASITDACKKVDISRSTYYRYCN